jgi:hypothetical protein
VTLSHVAVTADLADMVDSDTPVTGIVTFQAPAALTLDDGTILGNRIAAARNIAGGEFETPLSLPPVDDPTEEPQSWYWTVTINTNVLAIEFHTLITTDMVADGITLGQLLRSAVDVPPPPGQTGTTVDSVARNQIAAEVTRATGAEDTLTDSVTAEVTRASIAEATLSGSIGTRYTKPGDGIPEADLSADVQAKLDAGGGGGGSTRVVVRGRITTGNTSPVANTAGAWLPVPGTDVTIPATAGDQVGAQFMILTHGDSGARYDIGVVVGGALVRLLGTDEFPPRSGYEGLPGLYPDGDFPGTYGFIDFVAGSGDLDGADVRFCVAVKAGGAGTLYAEPEHPLTYRLVNEGP